MATLYGKVKGMVNWAKVYEPDVAFGDEKWKIDFYPLDDTQWGMFDKLGLTVRRRENTDLDREFVKLSRPVRKQINGVMVEFTSPRIVNKDNSPVREYRKPNGELLKSYPQDAKPEMSMVGESVLIGNGSEIELTLISYDTPVGKGHRIEELKILDLVIYNSEDVTVVSDEPTGNSDEQPAWV